MIWTEKEVSEASSPKGVDLPADDAEPMKAVGSQTSESALSKEISPPGEEKISKGTSEKKSSTSSVKKGRAAPKKFSVTSAASTVQSTVSSAPQSDGLFGGDSNLIAVSFRKFSICFLLLCLIISIQ